MQNRNRNILCRKANIKISKGHHGESLKFKVRLIYLLTSCEPYVIKPCDHYLSRYECGYLGNNIIYETKEISMLPYFKILMK